MSARSASWLPSAPAVFSPCMSPIGQRGEGEPRGPPFVLASDRFAEKELANGTEILPQCVERRGEGNARFQTGQGPQRQRGQGREGEEPQAGDRHRPFKGAKER